MNVCHQSREIVRPGLLQRLGGAFPVRLSEILNPREDEAAKLAASPAASSFTDFC